MEVKDAPVHLRLDHNTGDYVPYSYRTVSGFFNVPYYLISNKGYETGPPVYSPYPRRLESLTVCRCNYKGSTFSSVILRPWVLVRPESNSRPPAWQPDAQPTEPPVRGATMIRIQSLNWAKAWKPTWLHLSDTLSKSLILSDVEAFAQKSWVFNSRNQ